MVLFKGCHWEKSIFQGLPVVGGSSLFNIQPKMTTSYLVVSWLTGFKVTWLQHFKFLHSRVATYKLQIIRGCLDTRGRVCLWQPLKRRYFEGATFKTEGSSCKVRVLSMVLFKGCHLEMLTFQGLPVLGRSISSMIWQNMTTSLFVVSWLSGF